MKKISKVLLMWMLFLLPILVMAQEGVTIKGYVTDEGGNPLMGANVYVEKLNFGAATNSDGFYSFVIPRGVARGQKIKLVARFIGYKTRSKIVTLISGKTITQDFALAVDVLKMDAIVVTGMGGSQIKKKLGQSVARVSAGEVVGADVPNVVQAIEGNAPNVEVVQSSGDPGASSYIRIRGAGSIDRGTQPLFVVDGVPIDNSQDFMSIGGLSGTGASSNNETPNRASDLNAEDIQSIEILKGAAAAAIYGSRAANGVVLITTKSGKPGRTRISYKSQFGITRLSREYPLQRWYGQGKHGVYVKDYSRSWGRPLNVPDAPWYDPSKPEDKVYNHSTLYSDGGHLFGNNLTISGGNNTTTFFLSGGHYYEKGHWIAGSDYERTSVRLKGTQLVGSKLKFTGNIAYVHVDQHSLQGRDNLAGIGIAALRCPPEWNNWPYIDPKTGYHRSFRYSEAKELKKSRGFDNPYFIMYEHKNPHLENRAYGYVKAEYDLTNWINVSYHLGGDFITDHRANILPPGNSREPLGRILKATFIREQIDGNLLVTIQGDKFLHRWSWIDATLMLGHNANIRKYHRLAAAGIDMGVPEGFDELDNCVDVIPDEYQWQRNIESFYGQLTIDLFDQLYLTGAMRNDGASTFGVAKKRYWYPKASAAWEFTRFKKIPFISFGKLRAAYGVAGIQPGVYTVLSPYKATEEEFTLYTEADLTASYNGKMGFRHSTTLGNDHIKPERQREFEIGLDMAFLNSRVGLEATYYDQKNTDVIFNLNVAPSTGSFSQTANAATITNKGVELTLNAVPIKYRNFSWNLTLNWARNRSMVVDLSGADWEGLGGGVYAVPGHELGTIRVRSWMRFGYGIEYDVDGDGVKENIDEYYAGQWKKGDVWVGEDGKPVMAPTYLITPFSVNPRWTGSIRSEFTIFRNITVSALIDIVHKRWMNAYGRGQLYRYGTDADTKHRWHPDTQDPEAIGTVDKFLKHGEKTIGPGVGKKFKYDESWFTGLCSYSGDRWQFISDAGYVKVRELAITYRLPSAFVRRFWLSGLSIRLSARNLVTWTPYTGWSPDTNRSQATNSRGVDYFNSPQTRGYNVTLIVNY